MSKVTTVGAYKFMVDAMTKGHEIHTRQFVALVSGSKVEGKELEDFKFLGKRFLEDEAQRVARFKLDLKLLEADIHDMYQLGDEASVAKLMDFIQEEKEKFISRHESWNVNVKSLSQLFQVDFNA